MRFLRGLAVALALLGAAAGAVAWWGVTWYRTPGPSAAVVTVILPKHAGLAGAAGLLVSSGVLDRAWPFDVIPRVISTDEWEWVAAGLVQRLTAINLLASRAAWSMALLKLIDPDPAVAVTTPPQLFTTLGVAATTRPAGRVSVKLPLIATVFPLVMVNVMVEAVLIATVVGLKLLVIEGGCKTMICAVTVC